MRLTFLWGGGQEGSLLVDIRRDQHQTSHACRAHPIVQEATIRNVFDPIAIQDELLFCHHDFKFIHIKHSKSPLLGDVDPLAAKELELGPESGLNHAPCSAAWSGWTLRLGQCGPCPLCLEAFQRYHTYLPGV